MKNLSIVIPVFNEEKRIRVAFKAIKELRIPRGIKLEEIIFVNDGSTDLTLSKLRKFQKETKLPIEIISYPQNMGKGFAVKKGMLSSKGDYTLLCDADMSTPFSELSKFTQHINNNEEIVIGTRKNGISTVIIHQPKIREFLGKAFTHITKFVLNIKVTDFTCGFKLFSKNSIEKVFSNSIINRWGYDAEILFIAKNANIKIIECPVLWSNDKRSHVNLIKAVPQTFFDLAVIRYIHSRPSMKVRSQILAIRTLKFYKLISFNK